MYTISIVLSKDMSKVLMCNHLKNNVINFIGGKVDTLENPMDASYRELFEESGITKDDIELKFVELETATLTDGTTWKLYVTFGILNKDVELVQEKNPLLWIEDWDTLRTCGYDGDCLVYFNRAMRLLTQQKL